MRHLIFLSCGLVLCQNASCQTLFNNAVQAGLTAEGLRTSPRPGGGDYSEVQSGNGSTGASFRQWTYLLADDFAIADGGWFITTISVFGYQTGTTGTTVSTGSLEIRRGSYFGPTVAYGSFLEDTSTDIFRIFNGQPNDDRRVQVVRYKINRKLGKGRYWILFGANGDQNFSGPWSPFLTRVGNLTTPAANAVGRIAAWSMIWEPILDSSSLLPQDLPFIIEGQRLQSTGHSLTPFDIALSENFGIQTK